MTTTITHEGRRDAARSVAMTAEVRVVASIARGMRCGWYRTLFDLGPVTVDGFAAAVGTGRAAAAGWIDRQVDAGVLRVAGTDATGEALVLLPGEHVTALLGDRGDDELSGARAMAQHYRERMAPVVRAIGDFGMRSVAVPVRDA
ncbi:hypothetical protein [Agromyces sp. SYSU T00194]|uniref:hypothetical protein n=1 Tax=Agromyces chitinivorans TaxID=3158560 RepID=UPI0033979D07